MCVRPICLPMHMQPSAASLFGAPAPAFLNTPMSPSVMSAAVAASLQSYLNPLPLQPTAVFPTNTTAAVEESIDLVRNRCTSLFDFMCCAASVFIHSSFYLIHPLYTSPQTRLDLSGRTPDYVLHRLTTLSGLHGGMVLRQCVHFTCNGSQPPLTALPPPLAFFTALVELDLSHNQLVKIDGLDRMTELTVLRLDHNALKQLEGLEGCRKLRHISVTHNQVWLVVAQLTDVSACACPIHSQHPHSSYTATCIFCTNQSFFGIPHIFGCINVTATHGAQSSTLEGIGGAGSE
jgi:hypothetical protein